MYILAELSTSTSRRAAGFLARLMAACVDVPRWANFRQDTCAKYASTGLCAGGRVVDANASGSVFGYPERACCACGRSETMRRAEASVRASWQFDPARAGANELAV